MLSASVASWIYHVRPAHFLSSGKSVKADITVKAYPAATLGVRGIRRKMRTSPNRSLWIRVVFSSPLPAKLPFGSPF